MMHEDIEMVLKGRAGYFPQRSSVRASFISEILQCRFSSVVCLGLGDAPAPASVSSHVWTEKEHHHRNLDAVSKVGGGRGGRLLPDLSQVWHEFQRTLVDSPGSNDQRDQRPGGDWKSDCLVPSPRRSVFHKPSDQAVVATSHLGLNLILSF